jgi:hypothetical protein
MTTILCASLRLGALLSAGLLLCACSREAPPPTVPVPAAPASVAEHTFPPASPAEHKLAGAYNLWQDGEGGPSCKLTLQAEPILGGNALDVEADCDAKLKLGGDPHAWFLNADGLLVIIDAARQPLLRMEQQPDGDYKDRRAGDYVNAVLLTRP